MNFVNNVRRWLAQLPAALPQIQPPTVAQVAAIMHDVLLGGPLGNMRYEVGWTPHPLSERVRTWTDTGEAPAPDDVRLAGLSSEINSFFLGQHWRHLDMETTSVPDLKILLVNDKTDLASLAEFLATDHTFTSVVVEASPADVRLIGALQANSGVKDVVIHLVTFHHMGNVRMQLGSDWVDALAEMLPVKALHSNGSIESLCLLWHPPEEAMDQAQLDTLSRAIAQYPPLKSLQLPLGVGVTTDSLARALNRPMDRLTLRGDPADMTSIVNAICQGDLQVQELTLKQTVPSGSDCSIFIERFCELVKVSPNVKVLHLTARGISLCVDRLRDALENTKLRELHLETLPEHPINEDDIEELMAGLRLNSSLCMFTVTGASLAQEEEIRKLVDANAHRAARYLVGHAFARSMEPPHGIKRLQDAGPRVMGYLEARALPVLNKATHRAHMKGRLLDLASQANFKEITALCQHWADVGISLDQSVIDEVAVEASRQQRDAEAARSVANAVRQAIASVKRPG